MSSSASTLDLSALPPFVDAEEGRLMMALKFYELGRLSLGQAAELAGHTKRAFIDVLGRYDIPVVEYAADELAGETAW
jgi:predicted HTH domain antitoxin